MKRTLLLTVLFLLSVAAGAWFASRSYAEAPVQATAPQGCTSSFPLPNASDIGTTKFEKLLYDFLEHRCYANWIADRQIRNSGPFINNQSFGTHNAVKVFYSPEVWSWLKQKNREGQIPDGAMIVKEMFSSPAGVDPNVSAWTVMVKDKKGAYDGW